MPCGSAKEAAIRTLVFNLLAPAIANAIATFGLVVIAFVVIGQWPPQEMLIGCSIGGALSPFAWRMYRSARGYPDEPTAEADAKPPSRPESIDPEA